MIVTGLLGVWVMTAVAALLPGLRPFLREAFLTHIHPLSVSCEWKSRLALVPHPLPKCTGPLQVARGLPLRDQLAPHSFDAWAVAATPALPCRVSHGSVLPLL